MHCGLERMGYRKLLENVSRYRHGTLELARGQRVWLHILRDGYVPVSLTFKSQCPVSENMQKMSSKFCQNLSY